MTYQNNGYIAVIGGSVAGSEAAYQLAEKGFKVAVFDQLALPYGKIEDGLPKWHVKLRDKEEDLIDQKIQHPNIRFIPKCRLGVDIEFESLINDWNFSAVLLAIGAWKDRELEIPGIHRFLNKGLIYQNPLIKWFNHYHESDYEGPIYDIPDGSIVIGGGLASIDVIKIAQIYTVQKALLERGISEDIFSLERGIDRVLEKHALSMHDLGLKGATLVYRKSARDMPLKSFNEPEEEEKARDVSEKMLKLSMNRYKFNFIGNSVAVKTLVENDKLIGLQFQKTIVKDGQSIPIEGSEFDLKSPLIISSIGSLPEHIEGIPVKGNLLNTIRKGACRIKGYDNVFAIGNAVTGRGNIKESRIHGKESVNRIFDQHLDPKKTQFQGILRKLETKVNKQVGEIDRQLNSREILSEEDRVRIDQKIDALQNKVGYDGDYLSWKKKHLWERLELLPTKIRPKNS
jgi:NADPH-dependent glutamate synthase beta subunit-like oxidoreductase